MQVDFGLDAPVPPAQFAQHIVTNLGAFVAELVVGFEQTAGVDGIAERFVQDGGVVAFALPRLWRNRFWPVKHPPGMVATQGLHRADGAGKLVPLGLLLQALLGQGLFARLFLVAQSLQFAADVAQVLQRAGGAWPVRRHRSGRSSGHSNCRPVWWFADAGAPAATGGGRAWWDGPASDCAPVRV